MYFRPASVLALTLLLGAASPASAELFTCHQKPGQVLYSYSGAPGQYGSRPSSRNYSSSYTSDFAASSRRPAHTSSYQHYWNDRSRW